MQRQLFGKIIDRKKQRGNQLTVWVAHPNGTASRIQIRRTSVKLEVGDICSFIVQGNPLAGKVAVSVCRKRRADWQEDESNFQRALSTL